MKIAMLGGRGVPARYSGSETCVEEVGSRLVERGHEVIVYCRKHNSEVDTPFCKGMKRVVLGSVNSKHFDTVSHTLVSLLHNYRTDPADVLHFHGVGNSIFIPWLKPLPGKTAVTVDGPDWERPKWGKLARQVLKLSARIAVGTADVIITDSKVSQQYYRQHFGKETQYIPYGADTSDILAADALQTYGLERQDYLLFVGRLVPDKGVHLLVKAFESVTTDKKLVIVGDSPLFPDYVQKLKSTTDPRIKFLGYVFDEPYRQLCAHAYVYIQPSLVEGTSPALLAAMGAGNCVIASSIPENRETIGDAGLSFTCNDVEDLRRVLQTAVDNLAMVQQYRRKARQRVEEVYNWETITSKHEAIYQAITSGRDQSSLEIAA